jgi:hypothetical protein
MGDATAGPLPELDTATRYQLGIHAEQPLQLEKITEGKAYAPTPQHPAHYNVREVYLANVARGRWLFAFTFAAPYVFDNTSLLVYLDADNDPKTGRPGMGVEATYTHGNGNPSLMLHVPDELRAQYPGPRWALVDGVLFLSVDVPLKQEDGRSRFRLQILSEQVTPHEGRDMIAMREVTGPADSDRERFKTLAEREGIEGFEVTQDMAYLWQMQADRRHLILNSYRHGKYTGLDYNHSEYRWPSLRRSAAEGRVTVTVSRPGRYYPGVVVYDGLGLENYELFVGEEKIGHFSAAEDNRRQRLFFSPQSREFKRGDTLTLRAASTSGACIVEDIVLLAELPKVQPPPRAIENLQVGWDWQQEALRVTWTTTWPTACTLVHGGGKVVEEQPLQNHRMYLTDLKEGQQGSLRVEAQTPEGRPLRSAELKFVAGPPPLPRGSVARERLALNLLTNTSTPPPPGYPLTTGLPFAQGVLGDAAQMRLLSAAGAELPLQTRVLARWSDQTVKAVLLDTVMPAEGANQPLTLEYGHQVKRAAVANGVRVTDQGNLITVTTPTLQAQFDRQASGLFTRLWRDPAGKFGPDTLLTRDDRPVRVVLTDEQGKAFDTLGAPAQVKVEEAGALRTVIRLEGHHSGDTGQLFTYQVRLTFVAQHPAVLLSYRFGNDVGDGEFTSLRGIRLELPLTMGADSPLTLGAEQPAAGQVATGARLAQLADNHYTVGSQSGKRAPGWMLLGEGPRQVAVLPRHFWQLYPKAIGVEQGVPYYDIAPLLPEDQYAKASDFDVIKLYFYLQNGRYKFRQGMTMTHEAWLAFPAAGQQLPALCELVNQPPVLAASPDYYAATEVFGRFITRTSGRTPRYDEMTDRVRDSYVAHRENTRAYGMLNFGDQFGERGLNWFNGEYDHHFGAAQMFVRGGDLRWFHLMQEIARHDLDVDHCHYHTNPNWQGGKWFHAMGHTGHYFRHQFDISKGQWVTGAVQYAYLQPNGLPFGGMSPCHSWTEGTCQYYLLTGDPSALATARMLCDRYGGAYLNNYDFNNGRDPGWPLIFFSATYRTTGDPYYLNAARLIAERVLERRTPGGGWERQMVPGHCYCEPRCRGSAGFMQGVLAVGLREYYTETRDSRVPTALIDNAHKVIQDMWQEDSEGWLYTSCPKSGASAGRAAVMAPLLLFAWEHSQDPKLLDVTLRSMNLGLEQLGSMSSLRWAPYITYAMEQMERETPGLAGGAQGTLMVLKHEQTYPLEVRLFGHDGKPAPAAAATLTGPGIKEPLRPDATGRMAFMTPSRGAYLLQMAPGSGPWQVVSNLNRQVTSLTAGLELDLAALPARLVLAPTSATAALRVTLEATNPRTTARLLSPTGKELARASGRRLLLAAPAAGDELHEVVIEGAGRVRLQATGCLPWTATSPRRFFNASAPLVQIQGDLSLPLGRRRLVQLQAVVSDPEDDVVAVRWELPDGKVVEGPKLSWQPASGTNFTVRVKVEDRAGNRSEASAELRLPPPELEEAGQIVTVPAPSFSGQGEGQVMVTRRLGAAGPIITMWHANLGHWLEWKLNVPTAGEYQLYLRYATDNPAVRSLTVNGQSPGQAYERLEFPSTGGFSTVADNWQFQAAGPPLKLEAGTHTLRLTNVEGGLAVEYLSLVGKK